MVTVHSSQPEAGAPGLTVVELEVLGHGWTPEAGSELGWVLLLDPQLCKSLEFTSQVKVAKVKKTLEAFAVRVSAGRAWVTPVLPTESSFESVTLEFPGLPPRGIFAKVRG